VLQPCQNCSKFYVDGGSASGVKHSDGASEQADAEKVKVKEWMTTTIVLLSMAHSHGYCDCLMPHRNIHGEPVVCMEALKEELNLL
jgi:hypothetical protein